MFFTNKISTVLSTTALGIILSLSVSDLCAMDAGSSDEMIAVYPENDAGKKALKDAAQNGDERAQDEWMRRYNKYQEKVTATSVLDELEDSFFSSFLSWTNIWDRIATRPGYDLFFSEALNLRKGKTSEYPSHLPKVGAAIKYALERREKYAPQALRKIIWDRYDFKGVKIEDANHMRRTVSLFNSIDKELRESPGFYKFFFSAVADQKTTDEDACLEVAKLFHRNSYYKSQDFPKALEWYLKAAQMGHENVLEAFLLTYSCEPDDVERARQYFSKYSAKGAKSDKVDTRLLLGGMYEYNSQDCARAFSCYIRASAPEKAYRVYHNLRKTYKFENYENDNYRKQCEALFPLYLDYANQGDARSRYIVGKMCARGDGVDQSYKSAFECFTEASKGGVENANVRLAHMYQNQHFVKQDIPKAFELCKSTKTKSAQKWLKRYISVGVDDGLITNSSSYHDLTSLFLKAATEMEAKRILVQLIWTGVSDYDVIFSNLSTAEARLVKASQVLSSVKMRPESPQPDRSEGLEKDKVPSFLVSQIRVLQPIYEFLLSFELDGVNYMAYGKDACFSAKHIMEALDHFGEVERPLSDLLLKSRREIERLDKKRLNLSVRHRAYESSSADLEKKLRSIENCHKVLMADTERFERYLSAAGALKNWVKLGARARGAQFLKENEDFGFLKTS